MIKEFPVYSIDEFTSENPDKDFYANHLKPHVKAHKFTRLAHKHDFYLVILVTGGSGKHEIDFETYDVTPGTMFMLKPGQMHYWEFSDDIQGYVFFHSKEFYNKRQIGVVLKDFKFYASFQNIPQLLLKESSISTVQYQMKELVKEHLSENELKWSKIHALLNIIYIELSRHYSPVKKEISDTYLIQANKFEDLIEVHFKEIKLPHKYASKLNITEKHLNRLSRKCFNKTSTQLISERITLEAKRMLMHSKWNITEIGEELGFNETSYFIKFFKRNVGKTPLVFLKKYGS